MKWDRREIKSFRLKYRIQRLTEIFESENSNALFITINDSSKNDLKKEFIKDSLLLNNVSKKAIKYVCHNNTLINLLEGNVILAQNKDNQLDFKKILVHKKIKLNFYFLKQQIYRNKEKILEANTTTAVFTNHLTIASNNLIKALYLIKKHNQNSIF